MKKYCENAKTVDLDTLAVGEVGSLEDMYICAYVASGSEVKAFNPIL